MTNNSTTSSSLNGRVAIVTGAARGIGYECASTLIGRGASVVVADLDIEAGTQASKMLGDAAHFIGLDVSDESGWTACVAQTREVFGPPTVLINNAGIFRPVPFAEAALDDYMAHIQVNMIGPFLGTKAVLNSMIEAGGGSIVNLSSIAGSSGFPALAAYCASKWGVRGLTKSVAKELGKHGIRANCVLPGLIDTDMAKLNSPETNRAYIESLPVGHIGQPTEVAALVAYLASDEAGFITGSDFVIDGGQTI